MLEQDNLIISDPDEGEGETERFLSDKEAISEDIPQSFFTYFETSKTRASVCEKLILEELEDFTVLINSPAELSKDTRKLKEKTLMTGETDNDDDSYMEDVSDIIMEISDREAKGEKCHSEEMQKEEQRHQRERDFQEELKKIMEAEKLQQMELELIKRKAQEKIEQELLLQQKLIGDLRKRVEREKSMIEEEKERKKAEEEERKIKESEEQRKREVEKKKKREDERKRMEDEDKKKEEEEKRKREEELKRMEEEKRTREEEDKRKREEEWKRMEEEKRKREEEDKRKRKEEWKRMEEEEKRKEEDDKRKMSEDKKIMKERGDFVETFKLEDNGGERKKEKMKKKGDEKRKHGGETKRRGEEIKRKKEEEQRMQEIPLREEELIRSVKEKERKEEETRKEGLEDRKREEEKEIKREVKNTSLEVTGNMEGEKRKNLEELKFKGELRKTEEEEIKKKDEKEKRGEEEQRIRPQIKVRTKHEATRKKEQEEQKPKEWTERKRMDEELMRQGDGIREKEDKMEFKDGEEKEEMGEERGQSLEIQHVERKEEKKTKKEMEEQKVEILKDEEQEYRLKQELEDHQGHKGWTGGIKPWRKGEDEEKIHKDEKNEKQETVQEVMGDIEEKQDTEKQVMLITKDEQEEKKGESDRFRSLKNLTEHWYSSRSGPSVSESTASLTSFQTTQQHTSDTNICPTSVNKTMEQQDSEVEPGPSSCSPPAGLPERTAQKRLSWMKECVSWSELSLQNRRKQKARVRSRRGPRRVAEGDGVPPLCPRALLQSSSWKSLQEITTLTLEDLPSCSLSTLVQCDQLKSLTLRRCGLRSLEGLSQLQELCYIDLQDNDISFVDCENMTGLRVLRLAHNKLTSIHGLNGAENLDVLDLSHNSITRIAGLESVKRLQKLLVHHNQLISTKGLRDVSTLLHLDCSHNHLASVVGLESSALLHTLDLRANSLSEPPSLNNQVLLRELRLDDNSISSLQGLAGCWLPLLQHLSAAQNRITQMASMTDFVSLESLDLRFNCLSELQSVCENLEGCRFLGEVHLSGNPLQQERDWRLTLQKTLPGLRVIDSLQTDSCRSLLAPQQLGVAPDCFHTFCQAQLQQTQDLQQHHSRELSSASASLDALKTRCQHFTVALQLAEAQRLAHEHGDTSVSDENLATVDTTPEKTLDMLTDHPESESTNTTIPNRVNIRQDEDTPAEQSRVTQSTVSQANPSPVPSFTHKGEGTSFSLDKELLSSYHKLNLQNRAAVVIQQRWRKCRDKCGTINAPSITHRGEESGGDEKKMESRPSFINRRTVSREEAAAVIQAFWRGFALRRRLASALAAVTCPDDGEEDTLEAVDMEGFVFDEWFLENHWTSEDSPPRPLVVLEQPLAVKPPVTPHGCYQYVGQPAPSQSPKQAWMAVHQQDSEPPRTPSENSSRVKSASSSSSSALRGLSERSEKILEEWGFTDGRTALLMLKRAQKMKSPKQKQKKHRNPPVHAASLRNSNYQLSPVEAGNRPARHSRYCFKVGEAELGLQQTERTEQRRGQQAQQQLHTEAAESDSEHFLPELNSSVLSGGRVQLVADLPHRDHPQSAGLRAGSSLIPQPHKVSTRSHRNTLTLTSKETSSPKRVTCGSLKKERLSFRDNPVQLSGSWGGGKKRDRTDN